MEAHGIEAHLLNFRVCGLVREGGGMEECRNGMVASQIPLLTKSMQLAQMTPSTLLD